MYADDDITGQNVIVEEKQYETLWHPTSLYSVKKILEYLKTEPPTTFHTFSCIRIAEILANKSGYRYYKAMPGCTAKDWLTGTIVKKRNLAGEDRVFGVHASYKIAPGYPRRSHNSSRVANWFILQFSERGMKLIPCSKNCYVTGVIEPITL